MNAGPKFSYRKSPNEMEGWDVLEKIDGDPFDCSRVLCTLESEQCAEDACAALNRGLCESVDAAEANSRWS